MLADRVFDIGADVARTSTKRCILLNPRDIVETRQLANDIERVIGAMRQRYSILMSTLPIEFVKPKFPGKKAVIDKGLQCSK